MFKVYTIVTILLFALGCGDGAPPTISREKAVTQLQNGFSAAEQRVKAHTDAAAQALKEEKYDAAFIALESIKSDRSLTVDQMEVIRNSMQLVQQALADAIARGDTNAIRTVQMMRGAP